MIAAGVNVKALSTFMGHANRITLDQYGHLLLGVEDEAAGLLDAFRQGHARSSEGERAVGARAVLTVSCRRRGPGPAPTSCPV